MVWEGFAKRGPRAPPARAEHSCAHSPLVLPHNPPMPGGTSSSLAEMAAMLIIWGYAPRCPTNPPGHTGLVEAGLSSGALVQTLQRRQHGHPSACSGENTTRPGRAWGSQHFLSCSDRSVISRGNIKQMPPVPHLQNKPPKWPCPGHFAFLVCNDLLAHQLLTKWLESSSGCSPSTNFTPPLSASCNTLFINSDLQSTR